VEEGIVDGGFGFLGVCSGFSPSLHAISFPARWTAVAWVDSPPLTSLPSHILPSYTFNSPLSLASLDLQHVLRIIPTAPSHT
jgi:hypothetical protein